MNIVFWSPFAGKCCTTTSMIALGGLLAAQGEYEISMMQLNFNCRDLQPLVQSVEGSELESLIEQLGVDNVVRKTTSGSLDASSLRNYALALVKQKLNVFPSTSKTDKPLFEEELLAACHSLLHVAGNTFDYNLIDAGNGGRKVTASLFAEADLIVVCCNQDRMVLDSAFRKYKLPLEKTHLLLTNYDAQILLTVKNVAAYYKRFIHPRFIGVIPHSPAYANALNNRSVIKFLETNKWCTKGSVHYDFVSTLEKTARAILKHADTLYNERLELEGSTQ